MRLVLVATLVTVWAFPTAFAQPGLGASQTGAAHPVVVFTDHPRLFLRPARLRMPEKPHVPSELVRQVAEDLRRDYVRGVAL